MWSGGAPARPPGSLFSRLTNLRFVRVAHGLPRREPSSAASQWFSLCCGLLFVSQFVVVDWYMRGMGFYSRHPRYLGSLLASFALMTLVVRWRALRYPLFKVSVATMMGTLLLAELAYYRYYHSPLDAQAVLAARHAWSDVLPVLKRGAAALCLGCVVLTSIEYGLLRYANARNGSRLLPAGALVVGLLLAGNVSSTTSELRALDAVWTLCTTRDHKSADERLPLPELESTRLELPNVLFIITESVRAIDACRSSPCATGPEFDRLLPSRVDFQQSRSLSSYTAIALSALATGQTQLGPRGSLTTAPDFFDLANAVRAAGARYSLVYWSSQLAAVFERGPITQVANDVITAEMLLHGPAADIEDSVAALLDRRLAEQCEQRLSHLQAPRFVVLHLSGTHAPYAFDDVQAPLRPWQRHVTWSGLDALHRAYLNSILEQDHSIARCIRSFLESTQSHPWVVVYTSDHGEAFGEHSAIHHGQNLYDEQLRVPLTIAHGEGALNAQQAENLRRNVQASVTHLDLLPTLLDVLGLEHHIALQTWAKRLPGRSLLRAPAPLGQIPISNCTDLFPCPINTWGILGEHDKLTAQSWDGQWRCLSLTGSEHEVELSACAELRQAACQHFRVMPNSQPDPACNQVHRH